jgi:parvulin-like peptidyl-prolyl isomerase
MLDRPKQLWTRAPVIGSLALGAVLFLLAALVLPEPRERLVIDSRTVQTVLERRADRLGRELSPEEREEAIQDYVDEELLVREAYRRGLHLTNGSVRRRLLGKMRLGMNAEVPQPTFAQLRAYFNANSERYQIPEAVTFAHVYFEREGPEGVDEAALFEALAAGADFRALGDRFWLGPVLARITQERLAGTLGVEFAEAVFGLTPGAWAGPLESSRGAHYVYIVERHLPSLPELETIEDYVRVDWLNERRLEVSQRKLERMVARYRIEVEGRR